MGSDSAKIDHTSVEKLDTQSSSLGFSISTVHPFFPAVFVQFWWHELCVSSFARVVTRENLQ